MAKPNPLELAQKIASEAPYFTFDRKKFYIVERDFQIAESELLDYAKSFLEIPTNPGSDKPEELTGAIYDGKLVRWKPGTKLTWAIDGSFPSEEISAKARDLCSKAAADWNDAAKEVGADIEFQEVALDVSFSPVFKVSYQEFSNPNLFAVAFFPHEPQFKRVVRIGPATFKEGAIFKPVGVIRHELGHVLGFRHEHIRPEAPQQIEAWTVGKMGAKELGGYDWKSVMHYPMEGAGTLDFELTEFDKQGLKALYEMRGDAVKDYEP